MSFCQKFKQKIAEFKEKLQELAGLASKYRDTGKEGVYLKFQAEYQALEQEFQEFKKEYEKSVTEIIERFLENRENKDEKVTFKIEDDLSVTIEGKLKFGSYEILPPFPQVIQRISGNLDAREAQKLNLPQLQKVGGWLDARKAQKLDLPQLREVGRGLGTREAESLDLPQLRKVGRDLSAPKAKTLNLPQLREVGWALHAPKAQSLDLPQLQEVGGDLYINPENSSVLEKAKEWKEKGILKGEIKDEEGEAITV